MCEKSGKWYFIDLPTIDYQTGWDLQKHLLNLKKEDKNFPDVVLLLEHWPVFTLGRRGGMQNLKVSQRLVRESGIEIVPVERGGDITYHGPGQLVGYPVINLSGNGLKVVDYVGQLEEALIRTVSGWGIIAARNDLNRGIWVENRKLGSIGIAVKRGVSFHGFALNVDVSLKPYEWINPCGLKDACMTSMARETGRPVLLSQVRVAIRQQMSHVFKIRWKSMPLSQLNRLMETV